MYFVETARAFVSICVQMEKAILTVEQAAEILQMHVATVRRMLRLGQLPGMKLGPKEWRIPSDALQEFIAGKMKGQAAGGKDSA
jgi:excisionase family DNA binding protein